MSRPPVLLDYSGRPRRPRGAGALVSLLMGFLGFPVGVAISVAYRFFAPIPEVRGSEWSGFLTFASTAVLGLAAGLLALCRLRSSGPKWAPWAAGIGVVLNLLAAVFAAFALRRLLHS